MVGDLTGRLCLVNDNDGRQAPAVGLARILLGCERDTQKICEKVLRDDQPTKFPPPAALGPYQVIVVNMRAFLGGNGGDNGDCIQLTYGNVHVGEFMRRYWTDPATGQIGPIRGRYENTNRLRGAPTLRQRIHGILFTRDTTYVDGGLFANAFLASNPHLVATRQSPQHRRAG